MSDISRLSRVIKMPSTTADTAALVVATLRTVRTALKRNLGRSPTEAEVKEEFTRITREITGTRRKKEPAEQVKKAVEIYETNPAARGRGSAQYYIHLFPEWATWKKTRQMEELKKLRDSRRKALAEKRATRSQQHTKEENQPESSTATVMETARPESFDDEPKEQHSLSLWQPYPTVPLRTVGPLDVLEGLLAIRRIVLPYIGEPSKAVKVWCRSQLLQGASPQRIATQLIEHWQSK